MRKRTLNMPLLRFQEAGELLSLRNSFGGNILRKEERR